MEAGMRSKTLFGDTEYYRAFPDPKDVFTRRIRSHAAALIPIGTLSLSHMSPKWDGLIHFILPVEPVGGCGLLGEGTNEFCNYLCRPNWIGYRMTGDKCELACDLRFFRKAMYENCPPQNAKERKEAKDLAEHYRHMNDAFDGRAAFYREHGWLCQSPDEWSGKQKDIRSTRDALVRLGGISWDSNWSNTGDFPLSKYPGRLEGYDSFKVYPKTEDGRDFHFIGSVDMWSYFGDTNGELLLFYDPEERVTVSTIDWS
jgi:hypothetical protein